jgi:glycosyltransferase involved in cell wall biosynthesis
MSEKSLKIRYTFNYPTAMDGGGGAKVIKNITEKLREICECKSLDIAAHSVDFDILIVFGFTFVDPEVLKWFSQQGVKVVLYPIFDRMKPLWQMKLLKPMMMKLPVFNIYSQRQKILDAVDIIITANNAETNEIVALYDADINKIQLIHYGIDDQLFITEQVISENLFFNKYNVTDFVFCAAASICNRKNQLTLIKALKGTGIKLVLNNTNKISDGLDTEFHALVDGDPDILCLERMDFDMMISCYKNAKVSVSVSQAETAGLVNLEAGYLGCNLVVSNLEALQEYLQTYATFVDQNSEKSIKGAIQTAMETEYNPQLREFVKENYTWDTYIEKLLLTIAK